MGFSTDYTDVQSFELIPKGEYEVIIKAITERTTPNGATILVNEIIAPNITTFSNVTGRDNTNDFFIVAKPAFSSESVP